MSRNFTALFAFLAERASMPFAWGSDANDCVSQVLGAAEAVTGQNIRARFPTWSSEAEALALIKAEGGLAGGFDARFPRVPVAVAHRGDIALVRGPDGTESVMVVEGQTLAGPGVKRMHRLPRSAAILAWNVEGAPAP